MAKRVRAPFVGQRVKRVTKRRKVHLEVGFHFDGKTCFATVCTTPGIRTTNPREVTCRNCEVWLRRFFGTGPNWRGESDLERAVRKVVT